MEIVATNGQVGTWQSSANRIEVWTEGKNGVTGTDGNTWVYDGSNGANWRVFAPSSSVNPIVTFGYNGARGQVGHCNHRFANLRRHPLHQRYVEQAASASLS